MKDTRYDVKLRITVTDEIKEKLRIKSAELGISMSELTRRILHLGVILYLFDSKEHNKFFHNIKRSNK